jgi:hypothetical protein
MALRDILHLSAARIRDSGSAAPVVSAGKRASEPGALAAAIDAARRRAAGEQPAEDKNQNPTKSKDDDDDDDEDEDEGDDESDEDEMASGSPAAAIRAHERGRVRAILTHPAAVRNPSLAVSLAVGSKLSRKAAIDALRAGAVSTRPRLADRMVGQVPASIGVDAPGHTATGTPAELAMQIIAAGDKARSTRRR